MFRVAGLFNFFRTIFVSVGDILQLIDEIQLAAQKHRLTFVLKSL